MTSLNVLLGDYRQCPQCRTPILLPEPSYAHVDLIKDGPSGGPVKSYFTPHNAGCIAALEKFDPGMSIRIDGKYLNGLDLLV